MTSVFIFVSELETDIYKSSNGAFTVMTRKPSVKKCGTENFNLVPTLELLNQIIFSHCLLDSSNGNTKITKAACEAF